jgi:hypothetical protein
MKFSLRLLVLLAAAGLAGHAMAESTYGYDDLTTPGSRTAKADLTIKVNIPKLILLRVGSSGATVDTATLTGAFGSGIPGGVASPSDGSNKASGWDGTAPTMSDVDSSGVAVYAWTNGTGASLSGAVTSAFDVAAIASKVSVTNAGGGNALAHPGANLSFGSATSLTSNTAYSDTWTYHMLGTDMVTFPAGSHQATVEYTATAP